MNRQNQENSNQPKRISGNRKKLQGADDILKRALAECMQEEADQAQKKIEAEGQHAFSKTFIEKMQFILKQGKNVEEQQKKKVRGRRWTRVAAACIVCVVVAGGSWIGLRGSLKSSQNETSASAARTEENNAESSKDLGQMDDDLALAGEDAAQDQKESTEVADASKQEAQEEENKQESMDTDKNTSATAGELTQNVDAKVLAVTPTSLKVRLTNTGNEDISFGDDYEGIERYDEVTDTWTECKKLDEIAYYDVLHVVKRGAKQNWSDWSVDWSEVYGSLETGHYRLQKNISIGNMDGGDQYVQTIQIAFDVR